MGRVRGKKRSFQSKVLCAGCTSCNNTAFVERLEYVLYMYSLFQLIIASLENITTLPNSQYAAIP